MSSEVEATVESEHVPEPKWPERIIVWSNRGYRHYKDHSIDRHIEYCKSKEMHYRILRVAPPVERRVEIEAIADIQQKCEQYWNAHNIGDAEIHAALEFIHREADYIYHSLEPKP